jgi:hypothetical protein
MFFLETCTCFLFHRQCQIVLKTGYTAGPWWLKSVILATWEGEIKRFIVTSQYRQMVLKTFISNITGATGHPCLIHVILKRQRSGRWHFEASLGKQFSRSYHRKQKIKHKTDINEVLSSNCSNTKIIK